MMQVIVPPPVEPVPLSAALLELRVDPDDPDAAAVADKLKAARQYCEQQTEKAFVRQTIRLTAADWTWRKGLELPRSPALSIVGLSYYDDANALQLIDPDSYYAVDDYVPKLRLANAYTAPTLYGRPDAVRIDYVAGYEPGPVPEGFDPETDAPQYLADNVPGPLKQAVLLTLRLLFQNLDPDNRAATEKARDSLLWDYRVLRV